LVPHSTNNYNIENGESSFIVWPASPHKRSVLNGILALTADAMQQPNSDTSTDDSRDVVLLVYVESAQQEQTWCVRPAQQKLKRASPSEIVAVMSVEGQRRTPI